MQKGKQSHCKRKVMNHKKWMGENIPTERSTAETKKDILKKPTKNRINASTV